MAYCYTKHVECPDISCFECNIKIGGKTTMENYRFKLNIGEELRYIDIEAPNYDEARILLYIQLKHNGIVEVVE